MVKRPLVSVVIPCFNSERWLNETLDSVFSQTYSNIEVIVVDDGSVDNTKNIVLNYNKQMTYVYQQNKGPAVARNIGIKKANGEYIAFLDSDDLWEENKLSKQVSYLEKNKDISLVFSNVKVINSDGTYLYTRYKKVSKEKEKLIKAFFMGEIGMNTPTIVARKTALDSIGGFDESLPMREDHYLLMTMAEKFSIHHFDEPLASIRINEGSMSRTAELDRIFSLYEPFVLKSIKRFPYIAKCKRLAFSNINMSVSRSYWKLGYYQKSINNILKAIYYKPLKLRNYVYLILTFCRLDYNNFISIKMKLKKIK
jgi:glycosyltransferase involved in cell wall biosynthesis